MLVIVSLHITYIYHVIRILFHVQTTNWIHWEYMKCATDTTNLCSNNAIKALNSIDYIILIHALKWYGYKCAQRTKVLLNDTCFPTEHLYWWFQKCNPTQNNSSTPITCLFLVWIQLFGLSEKEPSDIRTRAKLVERVPGHLLAAMRNVFPDIPTTLIISRGEVANSAGYYTIQSS